MGIISFSAAHCSNFCIFLRKKECWGLWDPQRIRNIVRLENSMLRNFDRSFLDKLLIGLVWVSLLPYTPSHNSVSSYYVSTWIIELGTDCSNQRIQIPIPEYVGIFLELSCLEILSFNEVWNVDQKFSRYVISFIAFVQWWDRAMDQSSE